MFQRLSYGRWLRPSIHRPQFQSFKVSIKAPILRTVRLHSTDMNTARVRNSLDPDEVAKFQKLSSQWWAAEGPLKLLHKLNPQRLAFLRQALLKHKPGVSISSLKVLDIGCGGGIFSESVARLGADVLGVDACYENVEIAKAHMLKDPTLTGRLQYRHCTGEDVAAEGQTFDVVLASEVIEHVGDPQDFVRLCNSLLKPQGIVLFTTINRTVRSLVLTIAMAEYVLGLVPPGTHDFMKYVTPEELTATVKSQDLTVSAITGVQYCPLRGEWQLGGDLSANYFLLAAKR
eukprot:Colp12_sorted_trinity150504_noHs@8126